MNTPKKSTPHILIFLHQEVEIIDFAGAMEVFLTAGFRVSTVALTKEPIVSVAKYKTGALRILPDYAIDEQLPAAEIASVYGGITVPDLAKQQVYKDAITKLAEHSPNLFSVCTGAFFLAAIGVLDGLKVTTYHSLIKQLQDEYPCVDVLRDVRWVDTGKIVTTAGVSAGIDGALRLVIKYFGFDAARKVAEYMEYDKWNPLEGLVISETKQ